MVIMVTLKKSYNQLTDVKKKSGKNGMCVSSKRRKGRLNKEFSV